MGDTTRSLTITETVPDLKALQSSGYNLQVAKAVKANDRSMGSFSPKRTSQR